MSAARATFCGRMATMRRAIADFKLGDLPLGPNTVSHNNSARLIRNGLAVQCFTVFEDFVKARTAEVLADIAMSAVLFQHLPERFQKAATVEAVQAMGFQLKLREPGDRIRFAQDHSERVSLTKATPFRLPELAFFHSSSNISKQQFAEALAAFSIESPWSAISGLCSRAGISGLPAQDVYAALADRRHQAAHDANVSVSENDLRQALLDAVGLALCFDILVSTAGRLLGQLKAAPGIGTQLLSQKMIIPLRFIKFVSSRFVEIREDASRGVRANADAAVLLAAASRRARAERGALIVFDENGLPENWLV